MTTHGIHGTYSRPTSQYVAPVVRTPAAPPEAMAALLVLLDGLDGEDEGTPCSGDDRWTADSPSDVAAAIAGCSDCPVIGQCEAYAAALRPSCGVWAGRRWTASSAGLPGHVVVRNHERKAAS